MKRAIALIVIMIAGMSFLGGCAKLIEVEGTRDCCASEMAMIQAEWSNPDYIQNHWSHGEIYAETWWYYDQYREWLNHTISFSFSWYNVWLYDWEIEEGVEYNCCSHDTTSW